MYKVVLIDDEALVLESLKDYVPWETNGFTVIGQAYNGISGLELVKELEPDAAFIDIRMPGLSGLDLLAEAKKLSLKTRFVIISGYAEFEYAKKAMEFGAIGYCLKPFDKEEIISLLQKIRSHYDSSFSNSVKQVKDYIHEHFSDKITMEDLAQKFYINSSYLGQLFRKEIGESVNDYIAKIRISYARNLLKDSSMQIHEIGERIGYGDYFHFCKIFKKLTGKTPSQFRSEN